MVPPCKGLRSLATIARSRLLRWAQLRLLLPLSTGAPYGLVLKVGAVKIPGCLFQLLVALGCRWYCLLKHCTVCAQIMRRCPQNHPPEPIMHAWLPFAVFRC